MASRHAFEITSSFRGKTYTNKIFAATKEEAIEQITKHWVEGVKVVKVEQLTQRKQAPQKYTKEQTNDTKD